jgi:hypothetical protein
MQKRGLGRRCQAAFGMTCLAVRWTDMTPGQWVTRADVKDASVPRKLVDKTLSLLAYL